MKKSILILIFAELLTACAPTASVTLDPCRDEENCEPSLNSAPFSKNNTESESYAEIETQPSTECEISATKTTVTTAETQSETVCTTTTVTNQQKEKSQYDPTESQPENAAEIPTDHTEENTENTTEKYDIPVQTEQPQTIENTDVTEVYKEETEPPEYGMSDYEMCCQYGLECYFAWTENQLYGHVANVVKIDGVWYVLDTQAGCFLTEIMCGFTEIVDANESYIANADIISSVRYE